MILLKPLIALVATSALAVKLVQHFSQTQKVRRAHDDRRQHREDMRRWEAEGGNLPTPQTTAQAPVRRRAPRSQRVSP